MRISQMTHKELSSIVRRWRCRAWGWVSLTLDGSQDDAGVVIGDDVGVTIFGLVHLQVGVFPGELLARIDRLTGGRDMHTQRRNQKSCERSWAITIRADCYHRKKRGRGRGRDWGGDFLKGKYMVSWKSACWPLSILTAAAHSTLSRSLIEQVHNDEEQYWWRQLPALPLERGPDTVASLK